ncbi:alpha/beta hydrolase [Mycolicibacterium brisbanense]
MGVLDAFYTTWDQARETFGAGTPQDGTAFDRSSQLRDMQQKVQAAAPDDRWQGSASQAYAARNQEHAAVYGKLADLDKRLSTEVTNSANVVAAGRANLDSTRAWVTSMVNSLPAGGTAAQREQALVPIVNKGLADVSNIVTKSHADMTDIAGRMRGIRDEYQALTNQKFAPGADKPDDKKPDDKKKGNERLGITGDDPGGPPQKLPDDPKEFRKFWEKLTPEERNKLYEQDHRIGNHPGMPFGGDASNPGKDYFNRKHLAELQQSKQNEVNQLQARVDDLARKIYMGDKSTATGQEFQQAAAELRDARHSLDGYNAVQHTLDKKDGVPRYLGIIDDQGHAAVSINNPDNASRSATFVPGTGQDMATFDGSDNKSLKMYQAALGADPNLKAGDVAVTTWMGYDRPMDLIQASSPDQAQNGGGALDKFLDGMQASHNGPPAIDTVIGHSYGSTLVGGAATDGHHLAADNVIAVGSPGMLSSHASDLNLDPGAHVYSMTAENDVIHLATDATLGADPFGLQYGATRLDTNPGPTWGPGLPSVAAHSSYWDDNNPGLANMGAIIAGLPPAHIASPPVHPR